MAPLPSIRGERLVRGLESAGFYVEDIWKYAEPAVVDDLGRLVLPEPVRERIGAVPGSIWHVIPLDGGVLAWEMDRDLAALGDVAREHLHRSGITLASLLDELPRAREAINSEIYGEGVMRELGRIRETQEKGPLNEEEYRLTQVTTPG